MDTICWFLFLARPKPECAAFGKAGGAYVNAFVAHPDEAIAEQIARDAIEEEHWRLEGLEQQAEVTRESVGPDEEHQMYFDQAVEYGHCLAFYCWPMDGEEAQSA